MAIVIMIKLGFWQLERAEQKSARLNKIEQRAKQAPFSLHELLTMTEDVEDFPAKVNGVLDNAKIFLVDNRIQNAKVGYEVLVPMHSNVGVVLVNLGWVEAGTSRQQLPVVELPEGLLTLQGMVALPKLNPLITETAKKDNHWPKVIQQNDKAFIEELLGVNVLPFTLLVTQGAQLNFIRDWKPVNMPPEKHLAYAIQWFGLAIACFLVYVFAIIKLYKNNNKE
jgi:cytochrome oxidase assembly protein ShyY1